MALKVGAADVADVKLGAAQVSKVMLGAEQVWPVRAQYRYEFAPFVGTQMHPGSGEWGQQSTYLRFSMTDADGDPVDLTDVGLGEPIDTWSLYDAQGTQLGPPFDRALLHWGVDTANQRFYFTWSHAPDVGAWAQAHPNERLILVFQ